MAFSPTEFRSQGLPLGGSRPSMFEVAFPGQFLPSTGLESESLMQISAASIPQARVTSIDVYYFGRPIRVVGERSFPPWRVSVYNDEDWGLRDFFEAWSNQMNTFAGNIQLGTNEIMAGTNGSGGYKVDQVIVRQYGKAGDLLRSYEFYGMYPEEVGEIQLNWENGNRIETFDVQFAYDFWLNGIIDTDQISGATYADLTGGATTTSTGQATSGQAVPSASSGVAGTTSVPQVLNVATGIVGQPTSIG